ncbi:MAG: hypothetical protein Q7W02_15780 [Candidatus Rokubacteria bacterium]|nr:hypothetical protein [Candidatus Rokubacteria bacterium]
MRTRRWIGFMVVLGVLTGAAPAARAADSPDPQQTEFDQTPPRLSYADGKVSFWRQGADDWSAAQVNTPLAPGDEVYTASPANLEIQIGSRAFVRTWANTQLGLVNQEPGFLQFKVTAGSASFDLRTIEPGTTVEVATPNAALTIEHAGYYRVDVTGERTAFITRRGGQATVTPASGAAVVITPSEEVVVEGTSSPRLTSYVAPQLDDWDKWNYARSRAHLDAVSARYVSPGTYGVSDLDRYGTWRNVPTYGSVWIPTTVQSGWAPYTTGSWTLDPTYGWTWVDTAPWGWAPYHHGRWVSVNGFWGWAPGPLVVRPVYAPALVAFFGGPSLRVGISVGGPVLGWVALGWGEPLVPWWGRPGFVHEPSWGGWGGPRVVNNVVINNTTVVNVQNINVYGNSSVPNAVVVVNENRFGRGPITAARVTQVDVKSLQPTHAAPQVTATAASFVPTASRGGRPPEESLKRSVVATRPPHAGPASGAGEERKAGPPGTPTPAPHLVSAPPRHEPDAVPARPPLGQSNVERRTPDGAQPLSPPKPPVARPMPLPAQREPQVAAPVPTTPSPPAAPATPPAPPGRRPEQPQVAAPSVAPATAPPAPARRPEKSQVVAPSPGAPPSPAAPATAPPAPARRPEAAAPPARHPLPGEPANRLSPNRGETQPPPPAQR